MLALPAVAAAAGPDTSAATAPLIKLLLGLVGVIAAVLVFSRVLSRLHLVPTGHARFKVLASLPVGQRERVVLMQAGERQIIVGVAPGRVSALHVLEEPIELDRLEPGAAGEPNTWLARALGRSG